jgi:hypothetical protein
MPKLAPLTVQLQGVCHMTSTEHCTITPRKYERYSAREGAIVALKPQSNILGQMIDIGMGGLSFRYIESHEPPGYSDELVILVTRQHFFLDRVPFKVVSDIEIENNISFSSIQMRRCSVEFVRLNLQQAVSIQNFIMRHTAITVNQPLNIPRNSYKHLNSVLPGL